jgi:hypothetical protein
MIGLALFCQALFCQALSRQALSRQALSRQALSRRQSTIASLDGNLPGSRPVFLDLGQEIVFLCLHCLLK